MSKQEKAAAAVTVAKEEDVPECVRVVVRCRPFSENELAQGYKSVVEMDKDTARVTIHNPQKPDDTRTFTFDDVFDMQSTQEEVYNATAKAIVDGALDGFNGTIFAYGQTGSGKTYTMEGVNNDGLMPRAFAHIFDRIASAAGTEQFLVTASYLEIYNDQLRDLLVKPKNQKKLELKRHPERGVFVSDLTVIGVKNVAEIEKVLAVGKKHRAVGATSMNAGSSRSHAIFIINVESSVTTDDNCHIRAGKINLVDLAGSERLSKTRAEGDRAKEGSMINLSLSALGNVINALVESKGKQHIPYRDSKLTHLLEDSLGGNTKTVMVAAIGPVDFNYEETHNTLRYAARAKKIQNKPKRNEDPKDAMLRGFQEEIARLREQLALKEQQSQAARVDENIMLAEEKLKEFQQRAEEEKQRMLLELQSKTDEEKKAMLAQQKLLEEQQAQAEAELKKRLEELENVRKEREMLAKHLEELKNRVVQGGNDKKLSEKILKQNKKQAEQIKQHQEEINRRMMEEERLKNELELQEEARMIAEGQFSEVMAELEDKTKKLKKLYAKYKESQNEVEDLMTEFQQEREDYLNTIREMDKELQICYMIIENFIPPEEVTKIRKRSFWDDVEQRWKIAHIAYAGNNIIRNKRPQSAVGGRKRPVSEYARNMGGMDQENPRYRDENIIRLDLDMPERTTADYHDANSHHFYNNVVQDVMDMALDDDTMHLTAAENYPNVFFSYSPGGEQQQSVDAQARGSGATTPRAQSARRKQSSTSSRPSSARSSISSVSSASNNEQEYPTSRGLVREQKRIV